MEETNHEYYVSLEVAKLLKEAGFNWECRGIYVLDSENDTDYVFSTANFTNTSKEIEGYIRLSAPTLEIAQRWLREVKRINIEILYLFEPCNHYFARACYLDTNTPLYIPNPPKSKIYEEVQEAGIKKALELILEKGE